MGYWACLGCTCGWLVSISTQTATVGVKIVFGRTKGVSPTTRRINLKYLFTFNFYSKKSLETMIPTPLGEMVYIPRIFSIPVHCFQDKSSLLLSKQVPICTRSSRNTNLPNSLPLPLLTSSQHLQHRRFQRTNPSPHLPWNAYQDPKRSSKQPRHQYLAVYLPAAR